MRLNIKERGMATQNYFFINGAFHTAPKNEVFH